MDWGGGLRGATPEGVRWCEGGKTTERPGSRGSRSSRTAQVTMESRRRRRPISTPTTPHNHPHPPPPPPKKKKKNLLRRKIIPSITERRAEKCLRCFSFSFLFFSQLLFTVSRVKWVFRSYGKTAECSERWRDKSGRRYVRNRILLPIAKSDGLEQAEQRVWNQFCF